MFETGSCLAIGSKLAAITMLVQPRIESAEKTANERQN
jgi:hypothetical protein